MKFLHKTQRPRGDSSGSRTASGANKTLVCQTALTATPLWRAVSVKITLRVPQIPLIRSPGSNVCATCPIFSRLLVEGVAAAFSRLIRPKYGTVGRMAKDGPTSRKTVWG